MMPTSIGDLARSFVQRNGNAQLDAALTRLSTELTTGRMQSPERRLSGDVGPIAAIERRLTGLSAYGLSVTEAALTTDIAQNAVGRIADRLDALMPTILALSNPATQPATLAAANEARETFAATIGALNVSAGGRTVFAGTGTGGPALADADAILADLAGLAAGSTGAADLSNRVDAYFAAGGGFEASGYLGETQSLAAFRLSPEDSAEMAFRADDPAFRTTLAALAKGALLQDATIVASPAERTTMLGIVGDELLGARGGITNVRAAIGSAQARIADAGIRLEAERTALGLAREDLIGIDPYSVASQLEQTRGQLETLYAVTARLSRLSLANYL